MITTKPLVITDWKALAENSWKLATGGYLAEWDSYLPISAKIWGSSRLRIYLVCDGHPHRTCSNKMNHLNQEQKPQAIHSPERTLNTQSKLRSPTYPQNQTLGVKCSSWALYIHLIIQDNILFTWAHFLFLLCIWMAAIDVKNSSEGKSSGSFVKNWAIWMKSILVKISSKSFNIPRAVRNKNSSPSRQNTSQTRQAKSSGKDLLYNVNILKNRAKFS